MADPKGLFAMLQQKIDGLEIKLDEHIIVLEELKDQAKKLRSLGVVDPEVESIMATQEAKHALFRLELLEIKEIQRRLKALKN